MKISRVINNNVICSIDKNGQEIVLMGSSIGFGKKRNDIVDEDKIEKVFSLKNLDDNSKFNELLSQVPTIYLSIADEIINLVKSKLTYTLRDNIYITLTDHISYAVERYKQGIEFSNAMIWEISHYYPNEFKLGQEALLIIMEHTGIMFAEDEAAFIALHIVNAGLGVTMPETMAVTKLIQVAIKTISYQFHINIDEKSLDYGRFITHLKFFAQRLFQDKMLQGNDKNFQSMIKENYNEQFKCAEKIGRYIKTTYNKTPTDEELVYLAVHIKRIT